MRISLNDKWLDLNVSIDETKIKVTEDLLVRIVKVLNDSRIHLLKSQNDKVLSKMQIRPVTQQKLEPVSTTPERPLVRDRLPNTSIIDPATLDVKKAVTEKALVRCPHCGQAHCLAISAGAKIYFMERDFDKNDFGIIAKFDSLTNKGFLVMCCKEDTNKLLYFRDLQDAALLTQEDFAATDETEIFCPVCHQSESFYEWKNAYINPLDYFETEHLCDACGGETVVKPDAVTKQKSICCETCGYTKPLEG
jgi:hypothetical protein